MIYSKRFINVDDNCKMKMQDIHLNKGLIVLGGLKNGGKTRFALQMVNYLAENEKVLYISYQDYPEKLFACIKQMGVEISKQLEIRSNLAYYGAEFFVQVLQLIKLKGYTTLIIDDMDGLNEFRDYDHFSYLEEETTHPLHFISALMNIRIIALVNIMETLDEFEHHPQFKHFVHSRSLAIDASQVFAFVYPYQMGIIETPEGESLKNIIQLYCVKNENNEEQYFELDNQQLNIFSN